jgi:acyl-CoA dehydrogenase
VLRRFEAEGRKPEDLPLMRWAMEHAFARIQQAFEGLYQNLEVPGATWLLRGPVSWLARMNTIGRGPGDRLGGKVAKTLLQPGAQRDRMTPMMHVPSDPTSALGRLERALQLCLDVEPVHKKLREGIKAGKLPKARAEQLLDTACERGILTEAERKLARDAEAARAEALAVDSFSLDEYKRAGQPTAAPQSVART